jgi:hypothetical protein
MATANIEQRSSSQKPRRLDCPYCYGAVQIGSQDIVESKRVLCPQCGQGALLTWEWNPRTDVSDWMLVDAALGAELCG